MINRLRAAIDERITARVQTPRDLLARLGRVAVWALVGLLLVRGAGQVLGHERASHPPVRSHTAARVAAWPDDQARALAVEFAAAYLTHTPADDAEAYAQRLTGMASSDVAGELVPRFDRRAPAQVVRSATVAGTVRLGRNRALITVSATVATRTGTGVRRLVVSVSRDEAGALVVDELPSFAAAPARARPERRTDEPLIGEDRGAIEDVLTRFLRSYLAGDSGGLAYLVAPGARIAAAAGRLKLLSLTSVTGGGAAAAGRRVVLATVHARDVESGALYMLGYHVGLVRRDRWYVSELNGSGQR